MSGSVESAIYDRLINNAGVSALVSDRVYDAFSPQVQGGNYPLVTFQRISGQPTASLKGSSGLAECRMQLNCSARTKLDAINVFTAIKNALFGFQGIMGTVGSGRELYVGSCLLLNEGDLDDISAPSADQRVYTRFADYHVWYADPRPALNLIADATQSTLTISPSTLSLSGTNTATIALTAKDSTGAALSVGGLGVTFSLSAGGGLSTATIGSVTDHGNGIYTATLTCTGAGTAAMLSATMNGQAVTATATITVNT